jgi:hypothetical protein
MFKIDAGLLTRWMALAGLTVLVSCNDGVTDSVQPVAPAQPSAPTVKLVSVTPDSVRLSAIGDTLRLTAAASDQNGNTISAAAFSWISQDTAVATVDGGGLVRSRSNGSTRVIVTSNGHADTTLIHVRQVVADLQLVQQTVVLGRGEDSSVQARAYDSNGVVVTDAEIMWFASNEAIAVIDDAGTISGRGLGSTQVTAKSGVFTDAVDVQVVRKWRRLAPTTSPSPREAPLMAFDRVRGVTVLFGGISQTEGHVADTWEFDGTAWKRITTSGSPPPLNQTNGGIAYDTRTQTVKVLGTDGSAMWEYDGQNWTRYDILNPPYYGLGFRAAYDEHRQVGLIFGGYKDSSYQQDTWELTYDGWRQVMTSPDSTPSVRRAYTMAYDAERKRTILIGGWDGAKTLKDAWAYNGKGWYRLPVPSDFPSSSEDGAAFDTRHRVLVFTTGSSTWQWNGSVWTELRHAGQPSFSGHFGMVYGVADDQFVVFGNNPYSGETWVLR